MVKLLSASPVAQQSGLAFIRIIVGLLMVYHGWEVFDAGKLGYEDQHPFLFVLLG